MISKNTAPLILTLVFNVYFLNFGMEMEDENSTIYGNKPKSLVMSVYKASDELIGALKNPVVIKVTNQSISYQEVALDGVQNFKDALKSKKEIDDYLLSAKSFLISIYGGFDYSQIVAAYKAGMNATIVVERSALLLKQSTLGQIWNGERIPGRLLIIELKKDGIKGFECNTQLPENEDLIYSKTEDGISVTPNSHVQKNLNINLTKSCEFVDTNKDGIVGGVKTVNVSDSNKDCTYIQGSSYTISYFKRNVALAVAGVLVVAGVVATLLLGKQVSAIKN